MQIYTTSVRYAAEALAGGQKQGSALTRVLNERIAAARTHVDPDLSVDGLARRRAELEQSVRSEAAELLSKLRESIDQGRSYLLEQAREHTQLPADAAALIQAEQKWRQVERMLDAGASISEQIRNADVTTALAIAEFAPGYLAAKSYREPSLYETAPSVPFDASPVRSQVYARLAEISPNADLRGLLTAATTADALHATAQPWLNAAQSLVDNGAADMLSAAVSTAIIASESIAPAEAAA